jgi:protein required for attachment to host cells
MLLPHGAIVAVVDGKRLELYRNGGNEATPVLAPLTSPKLDEHNKAAGAHHLSSSANPAKSQLGEDAHAAAVATWLNQQVAARSIEHLVVIAAPRTLGELRRHYAKALEGALIGELHKDLMGRGAHDVLQALHTTR